MPRRRKRKKLLGHVGKLRVYRNSRLPLRFHCSCDSNFQLKATLDMVQEALQDVIVHGECPTLELVLRRLEVSFAGTA